jgi:hypothetical protein
LFYVFDVRHDNDFFAVIFGHLAAGGCIAQVAWRVPNAGYAYDRGFHSPGYDDGATVTVGAGVDDSAEVTQNHDAAAGNYFRAVVNVAHYYHMSLGGYLLPGTQ